MRCCKGTVAIAEEMTRDGMEWNGFVNFSQLAQKSIRGQQVDPWKCLFLHLNLVIPIYSANFSNSKLDLPSQFFH